MAVKSTKEKKTATPKNGVVKAEKSRSSKKKVDDEEDDLDDEEENDTDDNDDNVDEDDSCDEVESLWEEADDHDVIGDGGYLFDE